MKLQFYRFPHLDQVDGQLVRAKESDAGYDIRANADFIIPAMKETIVTTGIAVAIPDGWFGRVSSRSGLAAKEQVTVFHGTVDAGYRGEVRVIVYNKGSKPFKVSKGDRIAQLIVIPCLMDTAECVEVLPESDRGENGFGSSGVQ